MKGFSMVCPLLFLFGLSSLVIVAQENDNVTATIATHSLTSTFVNANAAEGTPELNASGNFTSSVSSSMITFSESLNTGEDENQTCVQVCQKHSAPETTEEVSRAPGDDKIPLYITATYEGPNAGWDASGCVPAIEMAFDDINARTDILPRYKLRPIWNDTKCDAGHASRALFDQLYRKPTKIITLGGGCSPPTQAIANTAHYWNLLTISYSAESPGLSNRKFYPYFYRTVSPGTIYNYPRLRLLKEFGWNRVATIHDNIGVNKLGIDHMHDLLKEANITLVTAESFFTNTNPKTQIENIKRKDVKIIICNTWEDTSRKVFCEAYKQGITGKGYVWLIYGWFRHRFWETAGDEDEIDCTRKEMEQAVRGTIALAYILLNDPVTVTVANMTSTDYVSRYRSRLQWAENLQYKYEPYGAPAYDAAWTIALMLHEASMQLEEANNNKRLEDFTYNDSEMRDLFFRLLADVQFEGVSGPISFVNGDRIGVMQLEQLQIDCLKGWIRHANDCYTFIELALTWTEAETECARIGASLATFRTSDIVNFVVLKWPDKASSLFWMGLQQVNNQWKWSDSNHIEDFTWIPPGSSVAGTPDLHCMAMNKDGTWQARNCNVSLPYICKSEIELSQQIIGQHDIRKEQLRWVSDFIWEDSIIPLDHTPEIIITYKRVQNGIPSHIYFVMCGLAFLGGTLASSFFIFNIKFRKQRYMKMSSPNLNNVIILGSLLIYCWVVISGIDNTLVSDWLFSLTCQIRMWLISVGFVLSFGALFSKTWRVYRVATFKKPKRRIITDQKLLLLIGILFLIDVVILTLWQVFSPWYIVTEESYERDDPTVPNQKLIPYVNYCTCTWITYWLVALCGFKGLLIIFGMFLAWETRKVQISALNDSKLIGISVYNVVILCGIGGAISLIIGDPSTLYIFTASIVLFCTTLTLCTIFVPKIISVYKYPEGRPISTLKSNSSSIMASVDMDVKDAVASQNNQELIMLRKRVIHLEEALRKALGQANIEDINVAVKNDNQTIAH